MLIHSIDYFVQNGFTTSSTFHASTDKLKKTKIKGWKIGEGARNADRLPWQLGHKMRPSVSKYLRSN